MNVCVTWDPYFDGRGQTEKIRTLIHKGYFTMKRLFREKGADLFEHIVYRALWDAVAFKVDESHLLKSVHDFVGRFPFLRERVCMSEFAKVDQGNSKRLVRTSVLSNKIKHDTLEISRDTDKEAPSHLVLGFMRNTKTEALIKVGGCACLTLLLYN